MTPTPLIAAIQAVDTLLTIPARDGLATAALVADVVLTVAIVLLLAVIGLLLLQLRGIQRSAGDLLGRLEKRVDPVIDRAKDIAANVDFISAALRTDVQRVSESVRSLSDRLQGASDRMERRIQEFNALMEVVQSEAEDIFIGSAATVRGVRAGARALRGEDDSEELLDEDDAELADEAGLPPRTLGPAAIETTRAPEAAPGGVQVTGSGEAKDAKVSGDVGGAGRRAGA
jgi:hypothetical protein